MYKKDIRRAEGNVISDLWPHLRLAFFSKRLYISSPTKPKLLFEMPKGEHRIRIKDRFIQAVDMIAKENYPNKKEIDILVSLEMTASNYYRMKSSGKNFPTLDNCATLCALYGISEAWLLSGKGKIKATGSAKELTVADHLKEALRMVEKKK